LNIGKGLKPTPVVAKRDINYWPSKTGIQLTPSNVHTLGAHFMRQMNVRFSNRPVWVKRYQTFHRCGVDVAHGLVLLFGIGAKALPSWDSRTRRNNLLGGLTVDWRQVQRTLRSHLIHRPARDIMPPHGGARVSPIGFDLALSCCGNLLSGPAELGAVNPDAMHDDGQSARQCHDRLFHAAPPGNLHRPGFEPGPFC